MSEPSDRRNLRPPRGSTLWWYLWSVVVLGGAIVAICLAGVHHGDVSALVRHPVYWLVVAPMAVTALRPIAPKGRSGDGTFALVVFVFALLLRVGLPTAAVLCALMMLTRGAIYRQALHRNLFNAAQHVVTLSASWLVLQAFHINATPLHPWTFTEPSLRISELFAVGLAGLAYLIVNNGSVYIAMSIIEERSIFSIAREEAGHVVVVGLAMVSLSPLVLIVMVHEWPLVPLFYPALISLYYNAASSVANEHDALHDWLTGLGNRELLHREATRALDALPRQGGGVAVLVLDIDRFKSVNDTLGHAAGDRLLQIVAERLMGVVRPADVVARLGGDEFVILLHDVSDLATARLTAVRLLDRVNGQCQVDGALIDLRVSLGVAMAPEHGREFDGLLRRADRAMYVAKAASCGVAVFDPYLDDDRRRDPRIARDIATAQSYGLPPQRQV
ncbi:MAG TPA: GGDEF domain-containing protein [Acidothermaceae bacterium]|nr:GGDEF domain-containing protein [Acidothermaceae bacterium]